MKTYETSIAIIEALPDNIIIVRLKEDVKVDNEGLGENLEVYKQLLGDEQGLFLTIFNAFNTADVGVRSTYEAKQRIRMKKAEAFVVLSLSNRIELDYHIQNTKKSYPLSVFKDEKLALDWLKTFIEQ